MKRSPLKTSKLNNYSAKRKKKQRLYHETCAKVDTRDRGECQHPGCIEPATAHHHIIFKSQGGRDDVANLVSLCDEHHTGQESPHNKKEWRLYWEQWAAERYQKGAVSL